MKRDMDLARKILQRLEASPCKGLHQWIEINGQIPMQVQALEHPKRVLHPGGLGG